MFNEKEVRECYKFLNHLNETEIRIIDPEKKKQPKSFFVHSEDEFVNTCKEWNGKYNIYVGINEREKDGTTKQDVISLQTIVIDIDAIRQDPKDNPANEEELKKAELICDNIIKAIEGVGQPRPVKLHSGNGFQLWFAIHKIPIDEFNRQDIEDKVQMFQDRIIEKFDVGNSIDKIGDLPRIIKVWGTFNIKGKESEGRNWRVAKVIGDCLRVENESLKKGILELAKEKIPDYETETLEEIDLGSLPPCINYLLKYYENKDGKYWYRIIQMFASFFMSIGLKEVKTLKIIYDWNKKQEYHESGEVEEIESIVKRIYHNKITIPNCKKIKNEKGGFPYFGLAELKLCKPDHKCNKCINPIIRYKRESEIKDAGFNEEAGKVFASNVQGELFNQVQPIFYDNAGNWWLWNFKDFKWQLVDEVDILNMVHLATGKDIINPQERVKILNSLKQEGRKNIPKNIERTWIQFKDTIFDIKDGLMFKASPKYFVTNPIQYELNKDKLMDTPNMDRIFEEWVGKNHIPTLYEIIAYCLIPDYPIHRIFCFIGEGMNGKTCFMNLLKKFMGVKNICSTELDTLLSSRFEVTRLYKKLVCIMGETNFNEMSKTSILKKLTGGDLIGFEYKNKTPFEGINYAKILIATNNLPATTDKTVGFYRRWFIIDFPSKFSEKKDILKEIPEEEYECLALKCINILKDLLDKREFTNEGTIEDRQKRFEDKSNPFGKFIKENCLVDDAGSFITKSDFRKKFDDWCKSNRFRGMDDRTIINQMKSHGVESGKKYFDWLYDGKGGDARVWYGIKWGE